MKAKDLIKKLQELVDKYPELELKAYHSNDNEVFNITGVEEAVSFEDKNKSCPYTDIIIDIEEPDYHVSNLVPYCNCKACRVENFLKDQ